MTEADMMTDAAAKGRRKAAKAAKAAGGGGEGKGAGRKADPVLVRMVARALWRVGGSVPEDATPEARTAAWEAAKDASMATAKALVRQLAAKGVVMTAPAGGKAAGDDEG